MKNEAKISKKVDQLLKSTFRRIGERYGVKNVFTGKELIMGLRAAEEYLFEKYSIRR